MPELRVCPNCGAYVVTDRNVCPRCDAPLDEPAPKVTGPVSGREDAVADALAESDAVQAAHDELPAAALPWSPHVESAAEAAGESVEPALGEEGTASQPLIVREERPTMPGWMPEATLPAVQVGKESAEAQPALDAQDEKTLPSIHASGARRSGSARAPFEADVTLARLPENIEDELAGSLTSEPTLQFDRKLDAPPPREADVTSPALPAAPVPPPPASALRPPAPLWAPQPYAASPGYWGAATGFFQQRVQAYVEAGYRVHVRAAQEATLSLGKQLGTLGWVLAIVTIIGALWYLLILAFSGFRRDMVYLTLEADGRVYEDGPGAAHIRRQRSRTGRRWSLIGLTLLVLGLVLAVALGGIVGLALRDDQRRAAVSQIDLLGPPIAELFDALEVTPAITASDAQIAQAENAAVVVSLVGGVALVGIWGGAGLLVVGTVHALAFRTRVPPLPGRA